MAAAISEDFQNVLELSKQGKISESLTALESLSEISQADFLFLLESPFLKYIFDHFINTKPVNSSNINSRIFSKHQPQQQLQQQPQQQQQSDHQILALQAMTMVKHVLDSSFPQAATTLVKSNLKDFLCELASQPQLSEKAFEILSEVALYIPEIFQKQLILKLQRCLIEKCAQPAIRLEHFLRIFHNLREHSAVYPIDAYFYVNFLRLQYSASQKQRMTRASILLILQTLEHLINIDKLEESTISNVFSFLSDCFYPRICMEYHIMSALDSTQKSDSRIQLDTLRMIHAFKKYNHVPLAAFIAKQAEGLKHVLMYRKREEAILIVLDLLLFTAGSLNEEAAIQLITELFKWENFQKCMEQLSISAYTKFQTSRRIVEGVFDLLQAILKRDKEFINDFFLNEFMIGELAETSTFLDRKRRTRGVEMVIRILTYIDKQPIDKFILEDDEMMELDYSEEEIEEILSKKIIVSSVIDVFEVTQFPYDMSGATSHLVLKMQQLALKIKTKLTKVFGSKFPPTLESAASIPTEEKNKSNDEEWEDVDEENEEEEREARHSDFRELENIVKQFFK